MNTNRMVMAVLLAIYLVHTNQTKALGDSEIPSKAENIQPLSIGSKTPSLVLQDADGVEFDLNRAIKKQPTVIIFCRGGWCPYCNLQLGQLQTFSHSADALYWSPCHPRYDLV